MTETTLNNLPLKKTHPCRSADMNPHQSQAFILDVPVAQVSGGSTIGTSSVHDRYMTGSTRSSP